VRCNCPFTRTSMVAVAVQFLLTVTTTDPDSTYATKGAGGASFNVASACFVKVSLLDVLDVVDVNVRIDTIDHERSELIVCRWERALNDAQTVGVRINMLFVNQRTIRPSFDVRPRRI